MTLMAKSGLSNEVALEGLRLKKLCFHMDLVILNVIQNDCVTHSQVLKFAKRALK